jgi:hypothetical protein
MAIYAHLWAILDARAWLPAQTDPAHVAESAQPAKKGARPRVRGTACILHPLEAPCPNFYDFEFYPFRPCYGSIEVQRIL